jgi:SET domain
MLLVVAIVYLVCLQCFSFLRISQRASLFHSDDRNDQALTLLRSQQNTINALRGMHDDFVCRWYIAESAMPHSGLGMFTGIGLHKDEDIGYPDICLFVADGPDHFTHMSSHTWGSGNFFGSYEGRDNRAACEGLATIVNTAHGSLINTELVSPVLQTNAGLHRATSPGAGAITHNYGVHGRAMDVITAGSELLVDYFNWDFSDIKEPVKPMRDVSWLQKNGWCIDKIEIGISHIADAGRGAFARKRLQRGEVVAPAPLQAFRDRKVFQKTQPEQLYVNYCLQPADSTMLFFPYGQAVNLINHSSKQPNVQWRWSSKLSLHHSQWLDLSLEEFWKVATPGGLILEVVALRDIEPGEELLINYGEAWEKAWETHVSQWRPPTNSLEYVYPAELDETEPLRTVKEQETNPYPLNLGTVCATSNSQRNGGNAVIWKEPKEGYWWDSMTICHILSRDLDKHTGDTTYTVSLVFSFNQKRNFAFDPTVGKVDRYIDINVPRRAIRFIELPYMDDEHLKEAFRHPLELPSPLVPEAWKNTRFKDVFERL